MFLLVYISPTKDNDSFPMVLHTTNVLSEYDDDIILLNGHLSLSWFI